jgi:hypothetical protein
MIREGDFVDTTPAAEVEYYSDRSKQVSDQSDKRRSSLDKEEEAVRFDALEAFGA